MNNHKQTVIKAFCNGMTLFATFPDCGCYPTREERLAKRRGIGRDFAKVGMRIRNAHEREEVKSNG